MSALSQWPCSIWTAWNYNSNYNIIIWYVFCFSRSTNAIIGHELVNAFMAHRQITSNVQVQRSKFGWKNWYRVIRKSKTRNAIFGLFDPSPIVTRFPHFIHVLRCFKKTVTQLTTPSPPFRVTYFTNDPYFNFNMKLNVWSQVTTPEPVVRNYLQSRKHVIWFLLRIRYNSKLVSNSSDLLTSGVKAPAHFFEHQLVGDLLYRRFILFFYYYHHSRHRWRDGNNCTYLDEVRGAKNWTPDCLHKTLGLNIERILFHFPTISWSHEWLIVYRSSLTEDQTWQ